ncbi:MAG: ATP-binding protein, partial [Chloroflexota bacterium]
MNIRYNGDNIIEYLITLFDAPESPDLESVKAVIDTSPFPLIIIDFTRNTFIIRNKAHIDLHNNLVKNQSLQDMPFLIDSKVPYSVYKDNIEKATVPFIEEHIYYDINGQKLVFELYGYPIIDKKEGKHFVILHYNNKTKEYNILRENEDYQKSLQGLYNSLPGMFFRCLNETNWTVEFASEGCKELTGYSPKEIINNNKLKYSDLIHPEDKQMVWDTIQEAVRKRRYYDIKYRIITKKGPAKWVSEKGKANYDKFDNVVNIEGFILDISEGKSAEIKLKKELAISEAIAKISMELLKDTVTPIQVSSLVQDYIKVFSQSSFTLIYTPDENGKSYTLYNHQHDDHILTIHTENLNSNEKELFCHLMETNDPYVQNEPSLIFLPGFAEEEINVKSFASIPAFMNNKLSGLLIMGNSENNYNEEDIAVGQRFINMFALGLFRLKAEESLQEAKSRAEESDRLKSLFLSNMSHEIRTPMNAIVGFAEMLQDTDLNREQKNKFLEVIIKSGDNLLRLINDIIDISKIEAGQLKFDLTDCLVNEMIADLETYFKQEMIRQKKQHLNLFVQIGHPESDFALNTDCFRLKQIMNNLIGNAIKFTDEGFIEFGYKINQGLIEFFVRDSGIGIAPDKQKLIFERFGQVQEAISRNLSGTGLGLTISKNLVELLGGTIWVDSFPGEGSTFYFTLPLRISNKQTLTKSCEN